MWAPTRSLPLTWDIYQTFSLKKDVDSNITRNREAKNTFHEASRRSRSYVFETAQSGILRLHPLLHGTLKEILKRDSAASDEQLA